METNRIRRSIDFDPELYEQLKRNAIKNERSVQYMVSHIIAEYLKQPNENTKKPIKFF